MRARKEDLSGRVFGSWTVIGDRTSNRKWPCVCACGLEKLVDHYHLLNGASLSCRKCSAKKNTSLLTHGYTCDRSRKPPREYRIWKAMRDRCRVNPRYYERGICICPHWDSFEQFLQDMGSCPEGLTLDRRDNNLGYSKDNCRWATYTQQARNTRRNRILAFKGESLNVMEWSEKLGMSSHVIYTRLHKGWSVERTLSQPTRRSPA